MPRNGSGVYSQPGGTTAVSGATISSTSYNALIDDIGDELTGSLPVSGVAPMTGALRHTDGTVSAPGLAFSGATNTGVYRRGDGSLGFAIAGAEVGRATASGLANSSGTLLATVATIAWADVASAGTTDIGAQASENLRITGTTTITAFGTVASGTTKTLRFAGALTLTHNGTSLILPGAANITTAADDTCIAVSLGSGNWIVTAYKRATGQAIVETPSTSHAVYRAAGNLVVTVTGNAALTVTADDVVVATAAGGTYRTLSSVSLTLSTGSTGANALDAGTVANSTWYFVYVIYNPTTATTAGLLSTSATAPTLPSGYTYMARVGAVTTDGSANLMRTLQKGKEARYIVGTNPTASRQMSSGTVGNVTTPTWVAVGVGSYVPSTAVSIVGMVSVAASSIVIAAPNNSYGQVNSTTNPPQVSLANAATAQAQQQFEFLLESTNIYWASNSTAQIYCTGWVDA